MVASYNDAEVLLLFVSGGGKVFEIMLLGLLVFLGLVGLAEVTLHFGTGGDCDNEIIFGANEIIFGATNGWGIDEGLATVSLLFFYD